MEQKKVEQDKLCRMRNGWCRDCESSEYAEGCIVESPDVLTDEKRLMYRTAEFWNDYVSIKPLHPSEQQEMAQAIHAIQNIISYRIAKKLKPEIYGK